MIVRFGGGNSGIMDYLENGAKHGRHYSRDELDTRTIIDGDIDVTDRIIDCIKDKGQERYLHITLSFNEPDITIDKMQAAYEDYKELLLTAYDDDEINTYAEIHWPKLQQIRDRTTDELHERHPHVHLVIPKTNLLSGGYANPQGMYEQNLSSWEGLQEHINNKHGLKSPALSPRVSIENYASVLDRHKKNEFKGRSKAAETKRSIFKAIEDNNISSFAELREVVSEHGEVKTRNKGKDNEYLAVKLPGNTKYTNLNSPIFSESFIEKRELPHKSLSKYQIDNRLQRWETIAQEIKYISDAGPKVKASYRQLDQTGKSDFLSKQKEAFYESHKIPEPKQRTAAFRPGYSEFTGRAEAERCSLHDLSTRHVVHDRPGGWNVTRAELFLSDDEIEHIQLTETISDDGLQRAVPDPARIVEKGTIRSLSAQIVFEIEERNEEQTTNDLELFKEIRKELNPNLVLAYAQSNHLLNPEDHRVTTAKDGSARISFGKHNYNVSDFFTKGLGLEWRETKIILQSLYEAQEQGFTVEAKPNKTIQKHIREFEDNVYPHKIKQHNSLKADQKSYKLKTVKEINDEYYTENRKIWSIDGLNRKEREKLISINVFNKLVSEEQLKAEMYEQDRDIHQSRYPFSDHFKMHLAEKEVIDMGIIDKLKSRYSNEDLHKEDANVIAGKGFDFVLNGKEASSRAKLTAELENSGKPHTAYGYAFTELRPQQEKDSVIFFKGNDKLFETHPGGTSLVGEPSFDKVATALSYSLQRYGNPLEITGTDEFRKQLVEVSAANDLKVSFSDPALNEALEARRAEISRDAEKVNSISAPSLELDQSLGGAAAVDKALLESKQREIATAINDTPKEQTELASIAIAQRHNEHEREELNADTASKDIALYKELGAAPAMQAYFAVTMASNAAANADYKAELIANSPDEFMLTNHAAREFTDDLEIEFQEHNPKNTLTNEERQFADLEAELQQRMANGDYAPADNQSDLEEIIESARYEMDVKAMSDLVNGTMPIIEDEKYKQDKTIEAENDYHEARSDMAMLKQELNARMEAADYSPAEDQNQLESLISKAQTSMSFGAMQALIDREPIESVNEHLAAASNDATLYEVKEMLHATQDNAQPDSELDLDKLYKLEVVAGSTDNSAFAAMVMASDQRSLLADRIVERFESGEIESATIKTADNSTLLTQSAKQEGAYQVTHFDSNDIPLGDNGEMSLRDAVNELTTGIDIRTLDKATVKELTGEDFNAPDFELKQFNYSAQNVDNPSFSLVVGDKITQYSTAAEAGQAFFEADSTQIPSVIQNPPGGLSMASRDNVNVIAETHAGINEAGDRTFNKVLPTASSPIGDEFNAGFVAGTIKQEPAPLSIENAHAKDSLNKIKALDAPTDTEQAKDAAQSIAINLKRLQGEPELKEAAFAVSELTKKSPELSEQLSSMTGHDSYLKAVMTTKQPEVTQQQEKTIKTDTRDFDL